MKKLVILIVALAFAFGLAACEEKRDTTVLRWNIGADPLTLDPSLNGASDGGDVINNTFEGLVREFNGVVEPGIAESWVTSADGKTITFTLRDSVWSDGSDLTAADFVYTWLRAMDPATASEYAWIWEYTNVVGALDFVYFTDEVNNVTPATEVPDGLDDTTGLTIAETKANVGVSAPDDNTLVVELVNPTSYFVSLMAFYHFMPVKQSSVEAVGGEEGLWAKKPDLAVCNGPFKLTEYTLGDGLVLEKNDNYWEADSVKLEKIEGSFIDNESTAYDKYNAGELDYIPSVPSSEMTRLIAEDPEFHVYALLGTYYYSFNLDNPLFDNVKLRKALAYAIDREAIVESLGGGQVPAAGFIPPGFTDNEGNDFFEEAGTYGMVSDDANFATAVTLFAEAAAEMNMTVAELKAALAASELSYNTSDAHAMVAQLVQESWNQVLGFQMSLANSEWAIFQVDRKNGNFDVARGGWLTDFMDPIGMLAIFTDGNAYNDPNYNNPAFDTLISEAQSTTDPAVHFAKLYAAQDIFMGDMPIVPVYHYSDFMYVKAYLMDWGRSVLGTVDFSRAHID
ncbi:MAG: ABC transporter substrate-binding protein [Tenericutes bacterium HGW-Tenericutes-3]|nr:MAG: ABC transporter substrate-binding protein [Tenericutes bacterium HGW-Tenericutes-3]